MEMGNLHTLEELYGNMPIFSEIGEKDNISGEKLKKESISPNLSKNPSAGENDLPEELIKVKKTMTRHHARRLLSELALEQSLDWHFQPGTAYHCISYGDVDSLTFLRHIVKQQHLRYALLSTWCMAMEDIKEISVWLEKGYIDRFDFYLGEIFKGSWAPGVWPMNKLIIGTMTVIHGFDKNFCNCNHCDHCLESRFNREARWCNLGRFIISDPKQLDWRCPMTFQNMEEDGENEQGTEQRI